ncbi:MAG: helix-turn-helix domain-containing protein [Spongiibacteraceae bacterium]|nr:helix-turn-helix domain-containing protein [Spongiibacteraceae bacterium]
MKQQKTPIPVFKLYGETHSWLAPDLLHCESIAQRSQLHNWDINPHRHNDLLQMLYLQAGEAWVEIDGDKRTLIPPCMLLVAPMCVHAFNFSPDVQGQVLSLSSALIKQLQNNLGTLQYVLLKTACYPIKKDKKTIHTLFTQLNNEYQSNAPGRELLLHSLISTLMVWTARRAIEQNSATKAPQDRASTHLSRFSELLEQHFLSHRSIESYANELGITAPHLNSLCQRLTKQSALQMVHERLLLEAKRRLIYTAVTISQVSDNLGFSEPAYFTRFFKRQTGMSPKIFRQQRGDL